MCAIKDVSELLGMIAASYGDKLVMARLVGVLKLLEAFFELTPPE